ncbi:MAG: nucleoside kinase [Clostridia bacterium]|nr:nucleoside kinase [Clostridia bacterium]
MIHFNNAYIKYIAHLEQINDAALAEPERMIREVEASYTENLQNIARHIVEHHRSAHIVMLAGPSSSGKTTTAHLLREHLQNFGVPAEIISLDDFYLSSDKTPLLPDGTKDYETVNALDTEAIKDCLKALSEGRSYDVPRFDFTLGRALEEKVPLCLGKNGITIVEGIHALNPMFTAHLEEGSAVKLYVSVKQQIKDANGEVISPMDLRLVRRIVRDMQFRSTPVEKTLAMWPNVVNGEDRYIRPYRMTADYTVNSIHIYESCVLRSRAIPVLRSVAGDSPYYRKARDLEARLMRFEPINAELVPAGSMLREFLGR